MRHFAFLKITAALLILALTVSCTEVARITGFEQAVDTIPVAQVDRRPVDVRIRTLGELHPAQSAAIVAPPVAGGMLQIAYIVETGAIVKEGDVIVQYDPSEQEYNLEQSQSQLEEAEQQIKKMKASQAVRVAQEQVSLLRAQFEVQRAELKVKGNELLSGIEARKNVISLEEAKRKLEQLQRDIKSRANSDAADLAMQNAARTKAMLGMRLAQQIIDNMISRAPIGGIVAVSEGNQMIMLSGGMAVILQSGGGSGYRAGSEVSPGSQVATIQSVDQMEISAKVIETDRASVESGQDIEVILDSIPMKTYKGSIKSLAQSAMSAENANSTLDLIDSLTNRSFPVVFDVDTQGDHLDLGVTAQVTIMGKNMRDALSIPRQALYQKEGKQVVYVRNPEGFEPHEVRVTYLTESRAIIDGIDEGTEVALVNPERQKTKSSKKTGSLASILGGGTQ